MGVEYTKAALLPKRCCVPSATYQQVIPPVGQEPVLKSIRLALSIQDPTSRQWDHGFPLLEESTELTAFPFPQNKHTTISPCRQLSFERGNVQNVQATADGMCDDYGYPGSGASTQAVQGLRCWAPGTCSRPSVVSLSVF